ncbi:DNA-3-methyladenine glycosylase I [Ktedonosporobacter rubrisoli]|nr:DNA-3-methyladenine glycosylase I [Ktedonosporobacter rubrisoli]
MHDAMSKQRCFWALHSSLETVYHDREWGVPAHDDRTLFEFILLEGAQAGLSWLSILRKREGYRQAFANFDVEQVARFDEARCQALLLNSEIIRNKLKIAAAVQNARAFLGIQEKFGSFDAFLWRFVDGQPRQNCWPCREDVPARTAESDALSKELKRRGFVFVGSIICYSFMQAIGMVNDHTIDCFRWHEVRTGERKPGEITYESNH